MSLLIEGGHSQTRGNKEVTAFCPECGDFASLSFTRQGLVATPEYIQAHSQIYHQCGSEEPCRLLVRLIRGGTFS